MKNKLDDFPESQIVDPEFALQFDGEPSRQASQRQNERKTRQFCRQVQRAINLAFVDSDGCSRLNDLFVEEVLPAPDCGRLLVQVLIPPHRPVADAMRELGCETPRLRSDVALAISRKRAPELFFVPTCAGGGDDE